MLRELQIHNLALIKELHRDFSSGLVVLTGETGAGKSIILQAIHLLFGGKSAASWIRSGSDTATVEALFEIAPERAWLIEDIKERGFESDGEILIKRILNRTGRTRYYINGSMATAKVVSAITENLLNVASQHDHQQLLMARSHLDFIDTIGEHWEDRTKLGSIYEELRAAQNRYELLQTHERDKEQRRDFLSFQHREIEAARINLGEDHELVRERDRLKASEDLKRLGWESHQILSDTVVESMGMIRKNLEQMAAFDLTLAGFAEEVAENSYHVEDHVVRLRDYLAEIPDDMTRLDAVTERIDLLQRLKRKYGPTLEEVLAHGDKAGKELEDLEDMDHQLDGLAEEIAALEKMLIDRAHRLSKARSKTARKLEKDIVRELKSLNFDQASFAIVFEKSAKQVREDITRSGWDRPEFFFSANPGEALMPLIKIASGGELSRLMLALKCILAKKDRVETVIFDEIDAGISGKAAEAVAKKIKELAGHHQVLCITHLPQIASFANEHFLVDKTVTKQRTRTMIKRLDHEQRVNELARMLDGESATSRTIAYARELIHRNQ